MYPAKVTGQLLKDGNQAMMGATLSYHEINETICRTFSI